MTTSSDNIRSPLFAAIKANVTDDVAADIGAAVRKIDPTAQIARTEPDNVLAVETSASADALREAIQSAGYIADVSAARPRGERKFSLGRLIGQSLLWLAIGALALPFATLLLMLVIVFLDPVCGGPGDSGGCAMGTFTITVAAIPFGAALGLAIGIWRGLR